jgi:hypothetical protein
MKNKYREMRMKKENKHGEEKAQQASFGIKRSPMSFNPATRLQKKHMKRKKKRKRKSMSSFFQC